MGGGSWKIGGGGGSGVIELGWGGSWGRIFVPNPWEVGTACVRGDEGGLSFFLFVFFAFLVFGRLAGRFWGLFFFPVWIERGLAWTCWVGLAVVIIIVLLFFSLWFVGCGGRGRHESPKTRPTDFLELSRDPVCEC